ncbi:hypothetical protein TYRP_018503 [Tyrophagus putrescentiae]|nr:hypothetical protein TYRP_018503 [Tyrophagus putrescentiae]
MASTSSATPTTSSSTTSLGTNSLIDPLFTDPPDEDTVKAERKALRTKITRCAKMAATGQLIPTTEQDCNEWAEKLVEYDDFLGEAEEESPHYEKIRLIREHIRQSQADAVAAYNAHLAAQAALLGAPTGSFGGLSQHQPVHSQPAFSAAGGAFSAAATSVTSSGLGTTSSIPSLIGLSMSGAGRVSQPASSYMASSVSQPQWPPITTSAPSFQLRQSLNPLHSTLFPPSSTSSTFNQSSFRKFPTTVKKEDVPMFDGRAASWARFRELFESIVGENPNMKEIEKVEHLARAVPKRANLIRTANSWIAAMQDLEQLYADPDAVVNDVHRIVCEVRPVPKYAKLEHWMDFHEEVLKVIRLSAHSGNTLRDRLHTELMSKMGEHRFDYAEGTFRRDLAGLNDFVSTKVRNHLYVEGKDATARASSNSPASSSHRGVPPKPKHSVHAVSQQSTPDLPCFFCDGQHLRVKCPLNMRQRTEGLRERRRCFRCLAQRSDPSHPRDCQATCSKCKVNAFHHLICRCGQPKRPPQPESSRKEKKTTKEKKTKPKRTGESSEEEEEPESDQEVIAHLHIQPKGKRSGAPIVISPTDQTYLPTFRASAEATDRRRSTNVRVFADGGSSASFVSEQTAAALGLQRRKVRPFKASVFGGGSTCPISERVTLRLRSQLDDNITNLLEALVMPGKLVMPLPLPSPELQRVARRQGIQLSESTAKEKFTEIDVLLGADQLEEILYDEGMGRIKPRASLSFEETRYGWILKGHTGKPTETYANCVYLQPEDDALSDDELPRLFGVYHSLTHEFYAPLLPELPVRPSEEPSCRGLCNDLSTVLKDPLSDDGGGHDQVGGEWRAEYDATLVYDAADQRYIAGFPWQSDQRPDNNEKSARGFAYHLRDVLRAKGQYQAYTEALMAFVKDGYAIELPHPYHHTGYHLLHFPVHKPESTTPIRPVFNASSADVGKLSLNRALCKGHWSQTQLIHELIRFRTHKHVLLGDIKQAFLQIRIKQEDRKYARYFWFDKHGRLRAYELTSLLFGAVSSPFILHAVLSDLFKRFAPELSRVIGDTYMDDVLLYADTAEELRKQMDQVSAVMAKASFTLHKWLTTPDVALALGLPCSIEQGSYLGVKWKMKDSQLVFTPPKQVPDHLSRRSLLSYFASIFDPLGLIGPFHTTVKLLMRDLLKASPTWDEPIGAQHEKEARSLLKDVQEYLPRVQHHRLVCTSRNIEMWAFGDASRNAYGVCLYLHDAETEQTELLLSRGHIPSRNKTIPELELVAATLIVDTFAKIQESLPFTPSRTRFFTDSQVTWHRIQADANRFPAFVMNRVRRIQTQSSPSDWLFIKGEDNPADLISRGLHLRQLHASEKWKHGPTREAVLNAEMQTSLLLGQPVLINAVAIASSDPFLQQLINNSYERLHFALTALLRVADRRMKVLRAYQQHYGTDVDLPLLTDILLWRLVQKAILPEEWHFAKEGRPLPASSVFSKKTLVTDRFGLLRVDRRLVNSRLPDEAKLPLALVDHAVVRSYVKYVHEKHAHHAGAGATKELFGRSVHLPNCRTIVNQVVDSCLTCRRFRTAQPYAARMAPLPEDRVTPGFAFECVGVDLFGPLHAAGGKVLKFYGMIFACCKSRAIHLELIESRSTEDILHAYLRFVSLYGEPKLVRSDNELGFAKLNKTIRRNYEAYQKALKKLQEHPKGRGTTWITSDAPVNSQHLVRWKFNVPEAPAWGGFYERLIQSVKRTLDKCRLASADTFEQIETLLREAQMVINSRPLVTSTIDGTVLTPAHLVLGHALQNPVPVKYALTEKDDTLLEYTRLQNELEKFWRIWENEYLLSLRHYKWSQTEEPQIDELVIVRKDGVPRYAWEMGRIRQVYRAKDGRIRAVQIELVKGGNLRNRQIQNVYPLEHPARPGEDVAKPVDDSISPLPPSTRKPESAATQSSVQASRLPATSGLAPLSR